MLFYKLDIASLLQMLNIIPLFGIVEVFVEELTVFQDEEEVLLLKF